MELNKTRDELSAFKVIKGQLNGDIHDLSTQCKDYEKKIVDVREDVELVIWSHINKYLKLDEFKAKEFEQSTYFNVTRFNDGLRTTRDSPAIPFSTLCAIEYDSDVVRFNMA